MSCLSFPFGTAIEILVIIYLSKAVKHISARIRHLA